tara:strand:- start:77304 stop:77567 length:264 start_codon:yes stop_codon:yes gene_type:complete
MAARAKRHIVVDVVGVRAPGVDGQRNRFEMSRIYAPPVATQMINNQSWRNVAVDHQIRQPVSKLGVSLMANPSITKVERSRPFPTQR